MRKTVTFTVKAKEVTKGRQKFISASAKINGKWYNVKFNRTCSKIIEEEGYYDITVMTQDINIAEGESYKDSCGNIKKSNDTIWVREIAKIVGSDAEEISREHEENRKKKICEVFGWEDVTEDNELPF